MALARQNAELDHDISTVGEHAREPLDFEIEHLESILASLPPRPQRKEVPA